jgi:hypothetical protein
VLLLAAAFPILAARRARAAPSYPAGLPGINPPTVGEAAIGSAVVQTRRSLPRWGATLP